MVSQLIQKKGLFPSYAEVFREKYALEHSATIKRLKTLIWIYFYLLIFEGALRKWILPGLATPLLIIRDPFALYAIFIAWNKGLLKGNFYITGIVILSLFSFITAITVGHGNMIVAIFGLRVYAVHFPFMYIIAIGFDRSDVVKFCKVMLWMSLFMIVIIIMQFFSPQSAWINRGVGGDETGGGFSGALGFFRPPGTFSFTNGTGFFFNLLAACVFYFWLNTKAVNKILLLAATIALLISVPLSISRSLFFSVIICAVFAIISSASKPKLFKSILGATAGIVLLLLILSQTEFFQTATAAFTARLEGANAVEGGYKGVLIDRYLGGMVSSFKNSYLYPFFGFGIGIATNVGAILMKGTEYKVSAEGEWGRAIGEQGLLLGLLVIIIRVAFSLDLFIRSFRAIRQNDVLPWMLMSFGITIVPQGLWAQPTALGFSTIAGGLILACFNKDNGI